MRRLYWLPAGVLLAAHAMVLLVARAFLPWLAAGALAAALYGLTLVRFIFALRDRRRALWITRAVDEPLFWLWGAAMLTLLAFPLELLLALVHGPLGFGVGGSFAHALSLAARGAYSLGLAVSGWAVWLERKLVRVRRLDVEIVDLPAELDGYRIAQLSDLHIGSFDRLKRGREWARLANAQRADLCVVTGDLVTSGSDFHADVAVALGTLVAPDGVYVILGNHDRAESDELAELLEAERLTVLRNEHRVVRRGAASFTLAGMDGRYSRPEDLRRTLAGVERAPVVLLAHYPSVFPAASAAGVALVLSGHTHGGQLGIPLVSHRFNLATLTGQLSRGLLRRGSCALYVNAGLGTTGPPMRLAVPPEIAVLTLRRAPLPERRHDAAR